MIIKRLIADETINAKESIGKVGRICRVRNIENGVEKYPFVVIFIKPITIPYNCTELAYSEKELELIPERDILAYLI